MVDKVVHVDQSPIGRTPRSNPATYTGVFDHVRRLFAETTEAKVRGYLPGRFSFNVKGGRCENCAGDGTIKIEMNFLPDVYVPCEVCHGAPLQPGDARGALQGQDHRRRAGHADRGGGWSSSRRSRRSPATCGRSTDVGLGYVRLGQPAPTLSGGEAQRVKLAAELQKRSTGRTVYVLDEPTTGLHFEDIRKLLERADRLVDKGNTVIVIEHNLDVIKTADWVIDMGPEGGNGGGLVVAEGTPEQVAAGPGEPHRQVPPRHPGRPGARGGRRPPPSGSRPRRSRPRRSRRSEDGRGEEGRREAGRSEDGRRQEGEDCLSDPQATTHQVHPGPQPSPGCRRGVPSAPPSSSAARSPDQVAAQHRPAGPLRRPRSGPSTAPEACCGGTGPRGAACCAGPPRPGWWARPPSVLAACSAGSSASSASGTTTLGPTSARRRSAAASCTASDTAWW